MNHLHKRPQLRGPIAAAAAAALTALAAPAFAAMMAPPSISIVSPSMGNTITGDTIPVNVAIKNFKLECANAGKTNVPMGEGHIHAMVDGMNMAHLTTVACSDRFSISGQGLKPGKHMLAVVLATDAHAISSLPAMTSFTYEPRRARPLPRPISGTPALAILSPKNGATVGKKFDLVLSVRNFGLSCDLEGKPDVRGWGHLHVMVRQAGETSAAPSTPAAAMMKNAHGMSMAQLQPMLTMAMPGMIGMPCTKTVPVDLSTWHGGKANIVVQLANNDHMPTMGVSPATLSVRLR